MYYLSSGLKLVVILTLFHSCGHSPDETRNSAETGTSKVYYYYFIIILSGVRLSPLGTAATTGLTSKVHK
jgi:hypothetical protein